MKKLLAMLLMASLLTVPLAGCGGGNVQTGTESADVSDSGETVADNAAANLDPETVVLYFVCDAPRDVQLVEDALNEKFQEEMNTTIEFQFSTWTDYTQKYDLTLMSGSDVDLIYAANWMSYSQYANQGAFLELNDLLPEYAPNLYSMIDESTWNQVSVNGNIYGIPSTNEVYNGKGILYRQDFCDKYDLPIPDSVENIEAYLLGVKENEPDVQLFPNSVEQNASGETFAAHTLLMNLRWGLVNEEFSSYGLVAEYDNPSELIPYWGSEEFVEDMKTLKKWADMGFWSRSVMSETVDPSIFDNGLAAMSTSGMNPAKASSAHNQLATMDPSYNAEYLLFADLHGNAWRGTPMSDMTAIPYTCDNPERALMVLDKLCTDPEYYELLHYGIEGTDYTLEDGVYTPILDSDGSCGYEAGSFDWAMQNPKLNYPSSDSEWYDAVEEKLKNYAEETPFGGADIAGGFQEDYSAYQAERAALGNVIAQYLSPLETGMVDDVDAAVEEFMQKAEEAGLSKIQAAYTEQWKAYCEEYGYVKE